jgi:hypothetical protein
MADNRRKLVVIENGTITAMASNPIFLRDFPFLASLGAQQVKGKKCSPCQKNKAQNDALLRAKAVIAGLPSEKKRRLKELLNAREARLIYARAGDGKVIQLTF